MKISYPKLVLVDLLVPVSIVLISCFSVKDKVHLKSCQRLPQKWIIIADFACLHPLNNSGEFKSNKPPCHDYLAYCVCASIMQNRAYLLPNVIYWVGCQCTKLSDKTVKKEQKKV